MDTTGHTFGGRGMDRYVVDYETVADQSAATAGAPAGDDPSTTAPAAAAGATGGEPDPSSAGATDPAPAWTPEQINALRDNPDFQQFFADEAGTIAEARFQHLLEQARGGIQPTQPDGGGGDVDLNQFLNPYEENFGANLVAVFNAMLQNVSQGLDQRLQPFTQQAEAARGAEMDTLLSTAISDHATTLGGLRGGDQAIQKVMAAVRNQYMPEAAAVYGNTEIAAQRAIDKAIRAELAYQQDIAGGAAVQNAEHLVALNGGRGELAAAANGVVTFPDTPRSARERVAAYAPQINGRT